MIEKLKALRVKFLENLETIKDENLLENFKKDYLWKNWKLSEILKWIKDLSSDEKKSIWPMANDLKNLIWEKIEQKIKDLQNEKFKEIEKKEEIDVSAEFPAKDRWHRHPISITSNLLEEIFISLWFKVEDGPQVENETLNFDMLNIPSCSWCLGYILAKWWNKQRKKVLRKTSS